jgi:hypothetical protein
LVESTLRMARAAVRSESMSPWTAVKAQELAAATTESAETAGISRENTRYHMVEPLIKQSWTARILAMFYEVVDGEGYLSGALKKRHTDQTWPTRMVKSSSASRYYVQLTKFGHGFLRSMPGPAQVTTGSTPPCAEPSGD